MPQPPRPRNPGELSRDDVLDAPLDRTLPCQRLVQRTGLDPMQLPHHSGVFYRIVPASRASQALAPAVSSEGRFHHDSQPALYVSPRPDWACHAIKTYVRPDDPPRVIVQLHLTARLLDLRDPSHCAACGIDAALGAIPLQPQRSEGRLASTWQVTDRARASGADGMIHTARSEPARWHVVLFAWSTARLTGESQPFAPATRDHIPETIPGAGVTRS